MACSKCKTPFKGSPEQEAKLRNVIESYADMKGALIPVLHKAQEIYGYLPIEVQRIVADGINIPLAQISSVVSFYDFFNDAANARYTIRMCNSLPCQVKGSSDTISAIEEALGIKDGETTSDGRFALKICECLGVCDRAPAIMVNNEVFGPILPGDVAEFLKKFE
jgi:NADP-reducing hydrogenase subunit HndA